MSIEVIEERRGRTAARERAASVRIRTVDFKSDGTAAADAKLRISEGLNRSIRGVRGGIWRVETAIHRSGVHTVARRTVGLKDARNDRLNVGQGLGGRRSTGSGCRRAWCGRR